MAWGFGGGDCVRAGEVAVDLVGLAADLRWRRRRHAQSTANAGLKPTFAISIGLRSFAGNGVTALSMMDTERGHAMAAQGRKHNWAALLLHPGAESGIGPEKMPMNGGVLITSRRRVLIV